MRYVFKSLATVTVEIPQQNSARMVKRIRFDLDSVMDHELEIGAGKILFDSVWIRNAVLSAMIVSVACFLVYGLIAVFGKLGGGQGPGPLLKTVVVVTGCLSFLSLTAVLSVRGTAAKRKQELVESVRGRGNWKIVDLSKWERFKKYSELANESDRARHALPGRPGPA